MQIFVKCGGEATAYDVDPSMSVEALKNEIENKEFIPSSLISLANNSGVIAGGSLAGNDIEDSDELELVLEVQGGMRKKVSFFYLFQLLLGMKQQFMLLHFSRTLK